MTDFTQYECGVDCGKKAPECKCRDWLDTKAELLPPQADEQGADASLCIECGAGLSSPSEAICYACASSAARALAGEK